MFIPIKFAVKNYTKNINRFVAFDLIAGDSDMNFRLVVSMKQTQIRIIQETINTSCVVGQMNDILSGGLLVDSISRYGKLSHF